MAKHPNEDLFKSTTMTFGEHLEELRTCLTKALIALVVGSLAGLLVANQVVRFIEKPLLKALEGHYSKLAVQELQETYGEEIAPEMRNFAETSMLIFEDVYVERQELERIAKRYAAKTEESTSRGRGTAGSMESLLEEKLPAPQTDMVKTRLWRPAKAQLTTLSPHESFMIWVKAGLVAGLILASPYMFYQVWTFVAAGLYPHEKRYVHVFLPFSLLLFLAGAAVAFFLVFGPVLDFLFGFSRMLNIQPDLRISEVISFVLFLPLGFGIAFQLPLVMLFLNRIGIFTVGAYLDKWRIAILVIFVLSMFLTPADPYSMLLMAVPLTGLYFLGVVLCKWIPRGRNPFGAAYEP